MQSVSQANSYSDQRFVQSINYTEARAAQINNRISRVERGANQGVAAVAAMMAAIRTPDPGKSTVSVVVGITEGRQVWRLPWRTARVVPDGRAWPP